MIEIKVSELKEVYRTLSFYLDGYGLSAYRSFYDGDCGSRAMKAKPTLENVENIFERLCFDEEIQLIDDRVKDGNQTK